MHYDRWLRASLQILGCTPFYTSYKYSSGDLLVGSPLLLYLDVRLLGFLPPGLTSGEARQIGPQLYRHDSFEPIQDGLGDIVFQGRLEHIPVEATPQENLEEEGLIAEENIPVHPDPAVEMVRKWSMTSGG